MQYIALRGNTYHYRRRIPHQLSHLIKMTYYFRTLSRDLKLAEILAIDINAIFDELLATIYFGLEPDISKLGISNSIATSTLMSTATAVETFITAIERSDDALKTITMHTNLLIQLLPKDISKTTINDIDNIVATLKLLPKRNIQKYKQLPIKEVININVPASDRLAPRGINAYLKTLKSFLSFCYKRNYIKNQFDIILVKSNVGSRVERTALDIDAIELLITRARTVELRSAYTILYLSGMRVSEAYKCKITIVDGVECFDLRDTSVKLKTKNSYRLIPVHKNITDAKVMLGQLRSFNLEYIAKQCSKFLKTGTLYSLRHSFATHLASRGVEPHLISELMGHKQNTMTLSRYIKGFPADMLKDVVDTLDLLSTRRSNTRQP